MWVQILLLIYQTTLKTSQKQRNLRFCHDNMKTVCNAFDLLLKFAKRIHYAKSAMRNFSIIVTENWKLKQWICQLFSISILNYYIQTKQESNLVG